MTNKIILFGFALLLALHPIKTTAQVLETEDAKALKPGQFEVGGGFEYQTSKEGKESALPLAIEYGISKKLTILVEPVGFTSIRPKIGLGTSGGGDLR